MSAVDELITWLRAQLDDDERVARAAWPDCTPDDPRASDEDIRHIARWDPARVLAEVEAKRRILDLAPAAVMRALGTQDPDFRDGYLDAHEEAVKLLAQPYAGRPGWREEWRAEGGS